MRHLRISKHVLLLGLVIALLGLPSPGFGQDLNVPTSSNDDAVQLLEDGEPAGDALAKNDDAPEDNNAYPNDIVVLDDANPAEGLVVQKTEEAIVVQSDGSDTDEPSGDPGQEPGKSNEQGGAAGSNEDSQVSQTPKITYGAYVTGSGWTREVADGKTTKRAGEGLHVEALRLNVAGISARQGGVKYRVHMQSKGWLDWVSNGANAGLVDGGLRVEAFKIAPYGDFARNYDVWYRARVRGIGWMGWTNNGKSAGTTGGSRIVEAIAVRLAPKGTIPSKLASSSVSYSFINISKASKISARVDAYMQSRGWLASVGLGKTAGLPNGSKRMEAFRVTLGKSAYNKGLRYRAYLQGTGWQGWKKGGARAGTTGKSRRVEAVEFKLTGVAGQTYDIYYRTYVQGIGWMAWARNGQSSGSKGLGLRVEALQVVLAVKGQKPNLLPSDYKGKAVDATVPKPSKLEVKLVPELAHGYKSPYYQRCIVMHDTTANRSFDYWARDWIERGGLGTQFMVNEKGKIRQYVDINQICWHVGAPTYASLDQKFNVVRHSANAGSAMNQCSIGIEIDHVEDGRPYPNAQLDAIDRLIAYIDAYYGFPATILQHKDYKLSNSDCSQEFQGYLRHLQKYRTTR